MNTLFLLTIFLLGTIFGSFLNALIWRTRKGMSVMQGRSQCTSCNNQLRAFELIPILSFLLQRGKCRHCLETISWQYPLVELSTGLFFVLSYTVFQPDMITVLFGWFLVVVLMFIFVYDLRYQLILDRITLPAIAIILVYQIIRDPAAWWVYMLGLLIGGGFFLLQFVVSRGRWIGGGDIRLGALMGVILGWKLLLVALMLAYVVGAMVSLVLVAMKKKTMASTTPFGTYLTTATLVVLFWGEVLLDWYLGLFI
jgi:prepilin signal peptidase PulO-like enzyme (type II secretory pathway)